ncbi:hypothetical protein [Prochlorococcus sp. MIT 1223]|uniref:hypothetical protein n=1 Tax=Prochlorococcus sp. MIT 1223 TaxID=3096217 RepID=UPI002A749992|nr:hypothetical protein [Prochlorococcus sp. MIT 1223]
MTQKIRFELIHKEHALEQAEKYNYEFNEIEGSVVDIIVDDIDIDTPGVPFDFEDTCLYFHLEPMYVFRYEAFDSEEDYERFSEEIREETKDDDELWAEDPEDEEEN